MEFKQVMVVRRDLGMGTGKIAAQVAHAAVMSAEKTKAQKREWFDAWFHAGQAKVVVKVQGMDELMEVRKRAESLRLPVVQVQDSGLTQIPPGTTTCIGIGPAPADLVDKVTSGLKLL
ncbi:MAG TPA: peptidyl-tRNA hydrolase Pth2 [Nitrososphaera sp.]|nr:peptidyl-tRNA hydrolase Pth2 [Nitrososphaera sp.]